ncbi:hypothetical protein UlMin_020636 [Ulmus minor]
MPNPLTLLKPSTDSVHLELERSVRLSSSLQGLRHGYSAYKFYTRDSYSGEWCEGQSHGVGVQSCSDGSCYIGEFKCIVKHGLGCYHFKNRDRYAGEYFGDNIHGFGVYHFAHGHCYKGLWHEGCKQGYGIYTFRNGMES